MTDLNALTNQMGNVSVDYEVYFDEVSQQVGLLNRLDRKLLEVR